MKTVHRSILLLVLAWCCSGAFCLAQPADAADTKAPIVRARLLWSDDGVAPGGHTTLAVVLEIQKPYHINSDKPKEGFIPTTVELASMPPGMQSSTPVFPAARQVEFGVGADKEKIQVFSEQAIIYVPMAVTSEIKPGSHSVEVKIGYQACDDRNCLFPTSISEKTSLHVVPPGTVTKKINAETFATLQESGKRLKIAFFGLDFTIDPSRLWLLLLIAAIGGMLLNFTPCVLPLIPIKIIGLSRAAGNRRRCFLLGLALSAGVVAFWLVFGRRHFHDQRL
jgi:hypothetical protein